MSRFDNFREIQQQPVTDKIKSERGSPITQRNWDGYPDAFELPKDKNYWQGKTILDVGSGNKDDDPNIPFQDALVCAIDPQFGKNGAIKSNTANEIKPGIVQDIPYPANTFDHVVSSHCVPQHIYPIDMFPSIIEMLRVMKVTGDIRLTPCVEDDIHSFKKNLEKVGVVVDLSEKGNEGTIAVLQMRDSLKKSTNGQASKDRAIRILKSQFVQK